MVQQNERLHLKGGAAFSRPSARGKREIRQLLPTWSCWVVFLPSLAFDLDVEAGGKNASNSRVNGLKKPSMLPRTWAHRELMAGS